MRFITYLIISGEHKELCSYWMKAVKLFHKLTRFRHYKKLLQILFGLILLLIGEYLTIGDDTNSLPPNCYSVNGKQICLNP
jgi:hypothetical protein